MILAQQLNTADGDFDRWHACLFDGYPAQQTYAVLDGVMIERLPEILEESGLLCASLFEEEMCEELARAAPYVVQLQPYHSLTQRVWAAEWVVRHGILLVSRTPIPLLIEQLRRLFEQPLVDGSHRLFRFYDPKVLEDHILQLDNELHRFCKRYHLTVFAHSNRHSKWLRYYSDSDSIPNY